MTANASRITIADDVAAAAARLTGTPEQLGARLRSLLDEGAPKPSPRESADARREREAETATHERTVAALRHRIATDFEGARGWKPSTTPFAVRELARNSGGGAWHRPPREWLATMYHPTFHRDAERRAAGMVAHPLADVVEADRAEIEAWAAERDLMVSFPDFPSWQDPSRNALAVFEPVRSKAAAAPDRATSATSGQDMTADEAAPGKADGADAEPAPAPDYVELAPPTAPDLPSMRPIEPIDLAGVTPRDLAGEVGPDFDIVAPAALLVDEQYQRNLTPKSLDLIRRIVAGWSWSKFKPPICTRVDGALHVIDGQHTAIGAASHGGIPVIPVVVVPVPEMADRAAAFVSHAKDRLQATALQVHRAALVAGDPEAVSLDSVCSRAGAELLLFAPSDSRYTPRQTVAVVGLRRLISRRGADRAAEVLGALAAADLAPITGDHIRLGELLLCDPTYADSFDADRLTAAMRGLTAKTQAEARELAIAQRLPAWRALAAVIARNRKVGTSRRRVNT